MRLLLRYSLKADENFEYVNPDPIEGETDDFTWKLEDNVLSAEMKNHLPNIGFAREKVEPYL